MDIDASTGTFDLKTYTLQTNTYFNTQQAKNKQREITKTALNK